MPSPDCRPGSYFISRVTRLFPQAVALRLRGVCSLPLLADLHLGVSRGGAGPVQKGHLRSGKPRGEARGR